MTKPKPKLTKRDTAAEDAARRPEIEPERAAPTVAIGVGGTAIYGGYIQPIESDSRLTGRERYKTFSNLLVNVSILGAGVRYFLNLVAKAAWKVEPADDSPRAKELAETVEHIMGDMETPWHRVVRRAAMYRFYGFSVQEWIAKRREDGLIGMADIEPRPQNTIERWDTERSGKVIGVVQRSPQTYDELAIPREKLVYLVDDSLSDSPEGLGLFRHCVAPAMRLRRYEQLEGFGFENDLKGVPLARAPLTELAKMVKAGKLTQEQMDALVQPLRDFIDQHIKNPQLGLLLDSQTWQTTDERHTPSGQPQFNLELLDGGTYSLEEVSNAIMRVVRELARILGVEHLLLGEDSGGSYALSRDKSHNFGLIIDSTLKELREQFQKDFLGPLWLLNGWEEELKPTLKTEQVTYRDIEQISSVLRELATAGIVLDRDDEAVHEVFDLLGLSRLVPLILSDPDAQLMPRNEPNNATGEMPEDPEEELNP